MVTAVAQVRSLAWELLHVVGGLKKKKIHALGSNTLTQQPIHISMLKWNSVSSVGEKFWPWSSRRGAVVNESD